MVKLSFVFEEDGNPKHPFNKKGWIMVEGDKIDAKGRVNLTPACFSLRELDIACLFFIRELNRFKDGAENQFADLCDQWKDTSHQEWPS